MSLSSLFGVCALALSTPPVQSPDAVDTTEVTGPSVLDEPPDTAVISGTRWLGLRSEPPVVPGPMLLERSVTVTQVPGGVMIRGRWSLQSPKPAWFANGILAGPVHIRSIRWNGRETSAWPGLAGPLVVERIDGRATLEVEAFLPGRPEDGIDLEILGAPHGTLRLEGFEDATMTARGGAPQPVLRRADGTWSTGQTSISLEPTPVKPTPQSGPIVVAQVGVGVTVGDAELRGRARLSWQIRQGSRSEVAFIATGVGDDLQVEGAAMARWRREGDVVRVELNEATTGAVVLDLRWSVAAPAGAEATLPMPHLVPQDVFRSTYAVQLARDGELDMRPRLDSWNPIASVELPVWGQALVEGTPTAAFTRTRASQAADTLELLRLIPVPGPPVVVDVADLRIATAEHGATIMRARYELRNERASHLVVTPPPGMRLVGVQVAGREVRAARDSTGSLRVPLKRSIETVSGLITVPVVLGFVGTDRTEPWSRRQQHELALPSVDAPIAVQRVSLFLPPRYESLRTEGQGAVVDEFDRGNSVGYGYLDDARVTRADGLFAKAVDAWNANEFDDAQRGLDELSTMGAGGQNTQGLQANLDLVRPRPTPPPRPAPAEAFDVESTDSGVTVYEFESDDIDGELMEPAAAPIVQTQSVQVKESSAVARRIRARARARSGRKRVDLDRRKRKAKSLRDQGRYKESAAEYRQAIEDSRDLDALEDEESVEYEFAADALEGELEQVESRASGSVSHFFGGWDSGAEYDRVSAGVWAATLEVSDEPDVDEILVLEDAEPPPPSAVRPVLEIPRVGELVRYQQLLLAEGEARPIGIDARRPRRRK